MRPKVLTWGEMTAPYPRDRVIPDLFAETAARFAGKPAVILPSDGTRTGLSLTYAQLEQQAVDLAKVLTELGLRPGDRLAFLLERSPLQIVLMLACLKAGAAYVPLDPAYPPARLEFMLGEAAVRMLVCSPALAGLLPETPCLKLVLGESGLVVEQRGHPAEVQPELAPAEAALATAYLMFTSGSTGKPKAVCVPQRGVVRLVKGSTYMRLDDSRVFLQLAPVSFDPSTLEIWGPLLNGGTCVLYPGPSLPDPVLLGQILRTLGVTSMLMAAALFNTLIQDFPLSLDGLEELMIGGEAMSLAHVRLAQDRLPGLQLINGYGPTESTVNTTCYRLPRPLPEGLTSIPIGTPVENTQVYVLDENLQLAEIGQPGELCIGGDGLASGYFGRPDLTAERFVAHPFAADKAARLYRTGDRVRWLENGLLEFLGRQDEQVKISGYRIELGEVRAALLEHPEVTEAAAAVQIVSGQKRLIGYFTASTDLTAAQLEAWLRRDLPAHLVPALWVKLEAFPLTPNGKIDTKALPAPHPPAPSAAASGHEEASQLETGIAALWKELLGLEQIPLHVPFFELGGTSLLAMKLSSRLQAELGHYVPIAEIFRHTSVRALAAYITNGPTQTESRPEASAAPGPGAGAPIAVIGMAARYPEGESLEEFWDLLKAGRAARRRFTDQELDPSLPPDLLADSDYVKARGVLRDVTSFDADYFGISPREAEVLDPQFRVFWEVLVEALEDAGCDPQRTAAEIGLFAGSGNPTYLQYHVLTNPEAAARAGTTALRLGNEKDFLVLRAAHLLGLRGPAVTINTACSTSLVAVAEAVQSLRAGTCQLALAGGVTIHCPPDSGGLYQEGSMQSSDGLTRPFDAASQGTIFNDGAGAVLLKPLEAALADGDHIYAVIRGIGLNNDGTDKMTFTAPSATGQRGAILKALADAGISPDSLGYLEAHGTATPIGDPIEVAALTDAWRRSTAERGFCWLGSVKSNIGHTVCAAGVAGLTKTALALHHRYLPGTVHFQAPNPHLGLDQTPFKVTAAGQPWAEGKTPRRAGVSSFGWGGTNAHVIVEEAPLLTASEPSATAQLLLLSARTEAALTQQKHRLAEYLSAHPETNLADAAWTLQAGRTQHAVRTFVTAATVDQAVLALQAPTPAITARPQPKIVFLFPGQGAQYAGMGLELYERSLAFRQALDECDALLQPELGQSLLDLLKAGDEVLVHTKYTQPALFAVMYSLARHWLALGVQPAAAVGHSVGEFAAATLAGVMDLKAALHLVAARGRLVDACAPGGMLAVRAGRDELTSLLPPGLDLAAENSPTAQVVAGTEAELTAFEQLLTDKGLSARRLKTSHAFHSRMMEPAVQAFAAEVAALNLQPARLPLVSTLTGTWLTADEATNPDYWARHLRRTVRFSPAAQVLLADPETVFLEVGPQNVLGSLLRQHPGGRGRTIVASLGSQTDAEASTSLAALGQLWAAGQSFDWSLLHLGRRARKISLPTYAFQRQRYWIEAPAHPGRLAAKPLPAPSILIKEVPMSSSRKPQLLQALYTVLEDLTGQSFSPAEAGLNFGELGLDSLQLTQAALNASKVFGVKLKLRHFIEEFTTPSALVDFLDAEAAPGVLAGAASPVTPASPMPAASAASPAPAFAFAQSALSPQIAANLPAGSLQALIAQQMELMRQQLALLSGGAVSLPAAPSPAPPVPAATVEPVAEAPPANPAPGAPVKAHGPQLVIDRTSRKDLSPSQEKFIAGLQKRYLDKTGKSREFTARNRSGVADPRAVAGFKPQMKEFVYPIVVDRSSGCYLWDLDGNKYVDLLSGYGSNFFGFGAPFVKAALAAQMEKSMEIGPQPQLIEEVSRRFREFVPMDRIAFCNTGSEAVLAALRTSRTATGKDVIVMFGGGYHGIFDEVVVRPGARGKSVPAAPGIPKSAVENILVLDWASDEALQIISDRADEIAAVITEPVQGRNLEIVPVDFLKKLRQITKEKGIALIFDEVVTGFRIAPGGAQQYFGIEADLATYGKVIGGGISIGIVAGKKEFMDTLDGGAWDYGDASVPEVGVTYFAGTFVRHPLALAVTSAVLDTLKAGGQSLYDDLNAKTARFIADLNSLFTAEEAPVKAYHFGSVMKIAASHDTPFYELLFLLLRLRGVHVWDGRPNFMTLAHTQADLDFVLAAFKDSITELQEAGFYPIPARSASADQPPVPGARLGRNQKGDPAWYIPDPKDPTKYVEWKQEKR